MYIQPAHSRSTGLLAITAGLVGLVDIVTIMLLYTLGGPSGFLNDLGVAIQAILNAALAFTLYSFSREQSPHVSLVALAAALVGAAIVVVGSALSIFGVTGWFYAGLFTIFGNALIGFWVVAINHLARRGRVWPPRLTVFGLATGVIMMFGLLTGPAVFTLDATQMTAPWWVYLGYAGGFGWFVLLPFWSLWLGRTLLSGRVAAPGVATSSPA